MRGLAGRPRRENSLSNYRGWLRQGGLSPSPLRRGRKARHIPILSQTLVCLPPPPPCLFMDNEGEGDTRGRLRYSLSASPPTPVPSEGGGGGAGSGWGAVEAAPDLDADDSGELAVGPVGTPTWRLDDLLHSA